MIPTYEDLKERCVGNDLAEALMILIGAFIESGACASVKDAITALDLVGLSMRTAERIAVEMVEKQGVERPREDNYDHSKH